MLHLGPQIQSSDTYSPPFAVLDCPERRWNLEWKGPVPTTSMTERRSQRMEGRLWGKGPRMPGQPRKDARSPNSRKMANDRSRLPPFPVQGSPSEWPHARVELTKVMNVSLPRPRSSASFKTESETPSPVSFYCRGIRSPFRT